jgi:hypothetical protein
MGHSAACVLNEFVSVNFRALPWSKKEIDHGRARKFSSEKSLRKLLDGTAYTLVE